MPRALPFFAISLLALLFGSIAHAKASDFLLHKNMQQYQEWYLKPSKGNEAGLHIQYFGVTSALISDGENSLMIDGFFTRPKYLSFFNTQPDPNIIATALKKANIEKLNAVLVVHSHFDHAMDAPEVAKQTGAKVYGSKSTANISRGWGLTEDKIVEVESKQSMPIGSFKVTFILSKHYPFPLGLSRFLLGKEIDQPLTPPSFIGSYKEGGSYTILIEHKLGNIAIQGSAGFIENELDPYQADTVLLGIGGLPHKSEKYQDDYLKHTALALNAKRVIPVHWDKMNEPIGSPLVPEKGVSGGFDKVLKRYKKQLEDKEIELNFLPGWQTVKLY